MAQNKFDALKTLYSLELTDNEVAFVFLGYSGILLRSKQLALAIDPGKSLDQPEISAIEHLDFLFFTHDHWDHYNNEKALKIIKQTRTRVVADINSSEDLKTSIPPQMLTIADSDSFTMTYRIKNHEVVAVALRGIHVGPINQYLLDLGEMKIYHAGDSGFWRHKNRSADIAFVPVGTATTCSPEVALAMVVNMQPKVTIPVHGNKNDLKRFKDLMQKILPDTEVIVPEKFKPIKISI